MILLYMRTLDGHLTLRMGDRRVTTELADGPAPTANIPEAGELARRVAEKIDGVPMTLVTETLGGIPTTAHILGGACMGADPRRSVTNAHHQLHDAMNVYLTDGAAMSSTGDRNPSLTYMAMTIRAAAQAADRLKHGAA